MVITAEASDQVMRAELFIAGTRVNMCDVNEKVNPDNMFLFNVFFDSASEVTDAFNQLAGSGKILTELGPRFWTPMYGEAIDRFGIRWQLMMNQCTSLSRSAVVSRL